MNSRVLPWKRMGFWLRRTLRRVWVRVVGFAILAMASAVLAHLLSPSLPADLAPRLGADAVGQILVTLASSMLAVTTFSLSIAVSAFAAAASTATPRATALLQEDHTTQNVLATFLGAFLFSLLGLIGLRANLYDTSGTVVLFLVTVLVVTLVIVALIRWIGHLMSFGRMSDTLDRVEAAADAAFKQRMAQPWLGGNPMPETLPARTTAVKAGVTGYIQYVDMQALDECAAELDTSIYLTAVPGSFVHTATPLVHTASENLEPEAEARIKGVFSIGADRTFEEDPRFGLIVLAEIASRALSPAVNDPGTAISVIGRLVGILAQWRTADGVEVRYPRLYVESITPRDTLDDAFRPIARDGADIIEVQLRLQAAFRALRETVPEVFQDAVTEAAEAALGRAESAGLRPAELAELRDAAVTTTAQTSRSGERP